MKMLLTVDIPHEPFNSLVRDGSAGDTIRKNPRQPQAGGGVFNADCHFRVVMSPDELGKAGLGELGKRWA
jgi:hypothetical protein